MLDLGPASHADHVWNLSDLHLQLGAWLRLGLHGLPLLVELSLLDLNLLVDRRGARLIVIGHSLLGLNLFINLRDVHL